MSIIFGTTGHRPQKLGPGNARGLAAWFLRTNRPDMMVIGMALGWDTAVAEACIELDIPFVAAVPFRGQQDKWPAWQQARYSSLLAHACEIVTVSAGGYSKEAMQRRNEFIVNRSTHMVALYDGSPSGTRHCLEYARSQGRTVWNLWPWWQSGAYA